MATAVVDDAGAGGGGSCVGAGARGCDGFVVGLGLIEAVEVFCGGAILLGDGTSGKSVSGLVAGFGETGDFVDLKVGNAIVVGGLVGALHDFVASAVFVSEPVLAVLDTTATSAGTFSCSKSWKGKK